MKETFIYSSTVIGIMLVTIVVAYLLNRFFGRLIRRSTADMNSDPTNYQFFRHFINILVYIVGFSIAIYSIPEFRTLASSLLAGAGILAVSLGFASQHALSNIVSGVFVVLFKPFRINDQVKIREFIGIVEDITLRHTVIRDFENKRIVIPNSLVSDEIIVNSDFAKEKLCRFIDVGISHDSNVDLAKKIMEEELLRHPLHVDPRTEEELKNGTPEVIVRMLGFDESSVNLRVWAWAKDSSDGFVLSCDLFESIKKRFDKEGIGIPFPQRTIVYKNKPVNDKFELQDLSLLHFS
ncbi:MAG: small conductance mechanosensitive channel [Salibacteraceae bacterium]|jgi:small conductance mechanosensitive channel